MVMYKIDRRGGVQKSFTRTDPMHAQIYFKHQKCEKSKSLGFATRYLLGYNPETSLLGNGSTLGQIKIIHVSLDLQRFIF